MIFRQLFEPLSSTCTYLLGCEETGQAVLIDPVIVSMDRDLAELSRLGLSLAYSVETHIHADHITAALELKKQVGSKIAAPAFDRCPRHARQRRRGAARQRAHRCQARRRRPRSGVSTVG